MALLLLRLWWIANPLPVFCLRKALLAREFVNVGRHTRSSIFGLDVREADGIDVVIGAHSFYFDYAWDLCATRPEPTFYEWYTRLLKVCISSISKEVKLATLEDCFPLYTACLKNKLGRVFELGFERSFTIIDNLINLLLRADRHVFVPVELLNCFEQHSCVISL